MIIKPGFAVSSKTPHSPPRAAEAWKRSWWTGSIAAALSAICLTGSSGAAQEGALARIVGEVYDSSAVRPLVSAVVLLEGTDFRTRTDRAGRFTLEDVIPGEYRLTFRHPRTRYLGVEPDGVVVVVDPGSNLRVSLGLPSVATLRDKACGSPADPALPGFLPGVVRSGGTSGGLAGAVVEGSWAVSGSIGSERAVSDETGAFTLCGLPVDVEVAFRAGLGREASIPTSLTLEDGVFRRRDFAVYPRVQTRIVGMVRDYDSGDPVEGAVVRLAGTGHSAVTGNSGRFVLNGVNVGQYRFEVEHLTYGVTADSMEIGSSTADVEVALSPRAIQLEGITVFSRPVPLENAGFYSRQQKGVGRYITRHEILRRNPNRLSEMLQAVPGVRLTVGNGLDYGLQLRNRCEPTYLVDGRHYPRNIFRIDDIHPSLIHGVEIYLSPSQIPPEYRRPQFESGGQAPEDPCGVVLIWTGPAHWDPAGGAED